MPTFITKELEGEVLIGLATLIRRLPSVHTTWWSFWNVELSWIGHKGPNLTAARLVFGLPAEEFGRLTRELSAGFIVGDADFKRFLQLDFQLIDGVIEAFGPSRLVLQLNCHDSTLWEVSTDDPHLADRIEAGGFRREGGAGP